MGGSCEGVLEEERICAGGFKFMGKQCPERGNPREFLEGLRVKKEELAQAGVVINEKDYFSVIISSLLITLEFRVEPVGSHSVFIIKEYDPR